MTDAPPRKRRSRRTADPAAGVELDDSRPAITLPDDSRPAITLPDDSRPAIALPDEPADDCAPAAPDPRISEMDNRPSRRTIDILIARAERLSHVCDLILGYVLRS